MPFGRYLDPSNKRDEPSSIHPPSYNDYSRTASYAQPTVDHQIFSQNVQFQVPQLILGPTIAPGGGAEVLPAGMVGHNTNSATSPWLAGAGFTQYNADWNVPPAEPWPVSQPYTSRLSQVHPRPSSHKADIPATSPSSVYLSQPYASQLNSALAFPQIPVSLPFPLPAASNGLPIYSASGFDVLSILARVATRPNPKIVLGPVDMTCSFVITDIRRFDSPVIYASPTFYKLTGYTEHEVVGKNCRFLQAPGGHVEKGSPRRHTAPEAVAHMRKSLAADKECQVSLINYRKGGAAFINLVTVIPVFGGVQNLPDEADEVVYQVGFQVDLTEQPNAILQKLRDGSYMVDYCNSVVHGSSNSKDWRTSSLYTSGVSKALRSILNDHVFLSSLPLSTSTTSLSLVSADGHNKTDPYDGNRPLSLLMLETSPDFVQVLSLKGTFLYVSPSVRRVLGYEADELVGKSVTDFCHEADKVPLVRELKESSAVLTAPIGTGTHSQDAHHPLLGSPMSGPRVVDLLFRMQKKNSTFIWLECRGRLYVEPGKGRKAIILSGRAREMPSLTWGSIARAGGLAMPIQPPPVAVISQDKSLEQEREFWALLSAGGSFLFVSTAIRDVLGWGSGEIIGRSICDLLGGKDEQLRIESTLSKAFGNPRETISLSSTMRRKDGSMVLVEIVFYHSTSSQSLSSSGTPQPAHRPLVCQMKILNNSLAPTAHASLAHLTATEVFDELDIARGSSWQYELQQLKFANQRLSEEVEALETRIHQENNARVRVQAHQESVHHRQSLGTAWADHLQNMAHHVRTSSKRSWQGSVLDFET